MKCINILIILLPLLSVASCKVLSNATLITCDSGGIIVDAKKTGEVAELQLGVPNQPLRYSELKITMNGVTYSWDDAIKQDKVRVDAVGSWPCNLVSKRYGSWGQIKGIQGYYFHDLEAHLYVADNKVYGIRLHNPPKDWDDTHTIILDGKDLRGLSVEDSKKLFEADSKFETSYVLWRIG